MKVLLAHSNFLKDDPKQLRKMRPYPPLATLYAAAGLRRLGFSVASFDATFAQSMGEFERHLAEYRPDFFILYEDFFNFISKMCLSRMRDASLRMTRLAYQAGCTVVAAGPDVSDHPGEYLTQGVDYALLGEPDNTLRDLITALQNEDTQSIENIPGLAFLAAGSELVTTPARVPEKNLDRFPFPAWDLVDLEVYRQAWLAAHGYFSLNMNSSRGCPFHCNWCAKPIWGNHYSQRSSRNVAEEMGYLQNHLQADHIWFVDDIFCLSGDWLEEFEQEVAVRNIKLPFTIQSRADLLPEKVIASLARVGCKEVWVGVESGSQKILDAMGKGIQLKHFTEVRALLRRYGLRACLFIQFGYCGETFDDIMATVGMIRELMPDDIGISVSYPLPGTRFHEMVQEQIRGRTHWKDSNDLAVVFKGQYQSAFYRKLHSTLHHELEFKRRLYEVAGDPCLRDELLKELDSLSNAWLDLGRMEMTQRNDP